MIKKLILTVSFVALASTFLSGTAYSADKKKCFALKVSERSIKECFRPILGDPEVKAENKEKKAAARAQKKAEREAALAEKKEQRDRKIAERKAELKQKREKKK